MTLSRPDDGTLVLLGRVPSYPGSCPSPPKESVR